VLRPFYSGFKKNFGGNPCIRYRINIGFKNAIVGEYPDFSIDLLKLMFAEGAIYTDDSVLAEKTAINKFHNYQSGF